GLSRQADVRATDLTFSPEGARFDVVLRDRATGDRRTIEQITMPMLGEHNVQNAMVPVAIAHELGLPDAVLRKALSCFGGVKRRFTKTGEVNGVVIVDDYAHHPVEIAAVLRAARLACRGKVIAVVQPHRYSRL